MEKVNYYSVSSVIDRFEINKVFDCADLKAWVNTPAGTFKPAYSEVLYEARLNSNSNGTNGMKKNSK